jgi:hypothetical protein
MSAQECLSQTPPGVIAGCKRQSRKILLAAGTNGSAARDIYERRTPRRHGPGKRAGIAVIFRRNAFYFTYFASNFCVIIPA